jgi:hypothetical protein
MYQIQHAVCARGLGTKRESRSAKLQKMMSSMDLKECLDALTAVTLELIAKGRENGTFASSQQAYFRWRLERDPEYTEKGIQLPPAHGETTVRASWVVAIAQVAQQIVPTTKEFQAALAALRVTIGEHAEQIC